MSDTIEVNIEAADTIEVSVTAGDVIEVTVVDTLDFLNNQFPYVLPITL